MTVRFLLALVMVQILLICWNENFSACRAGCSLRDDDLKQYHILNNFFHVYFAEGEIMIHTLDSSHLPDISLSTLLITMHANTVFQGRAGHTLW